MPTFARRRPSSSECWYDSSLSRLTYAHNAREWTRAERPGYVSNRARCGLNWVPSLRIIAGCERKSMSLRKVTLFDKEGSAVEPTDEDGQAKPAVLGVRWVNPHTFETIRVRGGKRTGPKNEVIEEIPPTLDLSPFAIDILDKARRKPGK